MSDVDINWFGREFLVEVTKANSDAMKKAAFLVEGTAKKSFGRGASKVFAKLTRRGTKFHRPSAPGQAPAVDFGILKSSVKSTFEDKGLTAFVGSDIDKIREEIRKKKPRTSITRSLLNYGFFLEVGTKFMAKRPWLRPALRKNNGKILRIFQKANS